MKLQWLNNPIREEKINNSTTCAESNTHWATYPSEIRRKPKNSILLLEFNYVRSAVCKDPAPSWHPTAFFKWNVPFHAFGIRQRRSSSLSLLKGTTGTKYGETLPSLKIPMKTFTESNDLVIGSLLSQLTASFFTTYSRPPCE